ncbi:MAG: 4-alpha-glucanotransferase, partial [Ardenticatenaceae bacterium]
MRFPRRSGILLHPTSLPGPHGIGDLGPEAYRFVDWLSSAGQRLWQVLPLGPTGYGDSPYQSFSAFAGNPLLISPERLVDEGWLRTEALAEPPRPEGTHPADRVDYEQVMKWKGQLLRTAFENFRQGEPPRAFGRWVADNEAWLEDYALFMALKEQFGGGSWVDWPEEVRSRDEEALARYRERLKEEIRFHKFLQYQFYQQWITLRAYARNQGVAIIGDIPIFIAHDSADAWANRELFYINKDGSLQVQAGVPPDYFSETGQLWGNPLYRWDLMKERGYDWWVAR